MRTIFDKKEIRNLKLKNRLFRSATWESLGASDGSPTEELVGIYEELARGGVGAIITGFTDVTSYSSLSGAMRLSDDKLIPSYRKLTDVVKAYDCRIIAQIAIGDYVRPGDRHITEPDKLSSRDIKNIIDLFAYAPVRAEKSGFDGVQIHAAHGFFLSRFISPAFNHRADEYGGSPEARAKILIDILLAIREKSPTLHITIKINFDDNFDGGLTPADALIVCQELAKHGIDSIEVSANGTSRPNIKPMKNEAYFLDFGITLKQVVNTPVILVGGHRSVDNMNKILNETGIEYLSLSRPLIREPNLPKKWMDGGTTPATCISCNACYRMPGKRCVFNL